MEQKDLEFLCGRPGFLFDIAFGTLNVSPPSTVEDLFIRLRAASEAVTDHAEGIIRKLFTDNNEDISFLHYITTVHNGVTNHKSHLHNLVATGIAIKSAESAILADPLIQQALTTRFYKIAEDKREKIMVTYHGTNYPKLAERAISLQLLLFKGTLLDLLEDHWKTQTILPDIVNSFLEDFAIGLVGAGDFDEFGYNKAHSAFGPNSALWEDKVVLARTGLSLPDIMFTARNDDEVYCLVSIQIKTWKDRISAAPKEKNLKPEEEEKKKETFTDIVLNVSRTHFLHNPNNAHQQLDFANTWKETLKKRKAYHVRVIISWAGFTYQQKELVEHFNQKNPQQPIVLISPSKDNIVQLYGKLAFEAIQQQCPYIEKKVKNTVVSKKEKEIFTESVLMDLLPQEIVEFG
jgi:hypothetical protein